MAKYVIEGGVRLNGIVKISGNKNSVLPCLAACLLTEEEVTLTNCPQISDVKVFLEILKGLGVQIQEDLDGEIKLKAKDVGGESLPKDLTARLRASVLLIGPLLGRFGKIEFYHPGGDIIGRRSIDTHIKGLSSLGFEFEREDKKYLGRRTKTGVSDVTIFLDEPSVTATENLILASVLCKATITLKNCAMEPHVVDLCNLLSGMGAKISGTGSTTLIIEGQERLLGTKFRIGQDFVEIGTYAVAAAITQGKITLLNCDLSDLEPVTVPLKEFGVSLQKYGDGNIKVWAENLKAVQRIHVRPWPGFPTDLMSAFIVLATQATGVTLLHDWMYESRMFFVDKLISMGASIIIADPHRVLVHGPSKLIGRELETPDIRAGMALVLASLAARGESIINKAELIERGYEDVVGNLIRLGVNIQRIE
ncbi:UDP-N-acetylglucosamine 1-carboxyvinyltransferase [Candidatus Daviesbacteria bacterium]|nr:UDP-N-acetylglucosamine 1-carboxyvinyltransferase [Candidatus Daviesbacteria bacterium]